MTPLERIVREEIEATGPMSVAAFMNFALHHPEHGYYATRRPIGAEGDFTTAPEVSQMFGELVGVWVAAVAATLDRPPALVEIGPGRGTLMADMARVLRGANIAMPLHLVETSPSLREQQQETLAGLDCRWHEDIAAAFDAYDGPVIVVANELLDALPINQFVRRDATWHERVVALVGDHLAFAASPGEATEAPPADATFIEVAPMRETLVATIASRIAERGGATLFVDYGSLTGGSGDTLQALRRHQRVHPLTHIGEADLTTHVDFAALDRAARAAGCETASTTQGAFLLSLGLLERAGRLGHAHPERQERLQGEVERLAGPEAMGDLFKVLALWHPGSDRPPGFGAP